MYLLFYILRVNWYPFCELFELGKFYLSQVIWHPLLNHPKVPVLIGRLSVNDVELSNEATVWYKDNKHNQCSKNNLRTLTSLNKAQNKVTNDLFDVGN